MVAMVSDQIRLPKSIENLDIMASSELRLLYRQVIGFDPPHRASRVFLTGNLAWALQARDLKKSPTVLREQMMKRSNPANRKKADKYKPGTRLVREWHGTSYEVTITERGYLWQDQHYRSLSSIARNITGARWSGPRFFGLTGSRA
jgi:hypothetical protein